jgi:hypothetical protein
MVVGLLLKTGEAAGRDLVTQVNSSQATATCLAKHKPACQTARTMFTLVYGTVRVGFSVSRAVVGAHLTCECKPL